MDNTLYQAVFYCFFFFSMMAFSLLINSILLRFVKTLGTKNQQGATVRWSATTKPAIGGLSFFIVFLICLCVCLFFFDPKSILEEPHIPGLLLAGALGFIMGLTDDAYNTRPLLKLTVQILCGVILVLTGTEIAVFENYWLNIILSVFWVVGIMNSINMLDNMDGIAAIVSAFILIAALCYLAVTGNFASANFMLLLGIIASLGGFLFYNWHPSIMYMGDTGSQFIGVILGYVGIHFCWNAEISTFSGHGWHGIAALLTVFLLPIADTTVVTINRLRKGQSPFVGGKDHTTHHLSYRGFTDHQVALIFSALSILSLSLYILLVKYVQNATKLVIASYVFYFLLVFSLLFGITEYNKRAGKYVD